MSKLLRAPQILESQFGPRLPTVRTWELVRIPPFVCSENLQLSKFVPKLHSLRQFLVKIALHSFVRQIFLFLSVEPIFALLLHPTRDSSIQKQNRPSQSNTKPGESQTHHGPHRGGFRAAVAPQPPTFGTSKLDF